MFEKEKDEVIKKDFFKYFKKVERKFIGLYDSGS